MEDQANRSMMPEAGSKDPETHAIIGAAMKVHSALGHGFQERVYHEAMAVELERSGIPFAKEVEFPIEYYGRVLETGYRADLVCYGSVIVELKAIQKLTGHDEAQLLNYLKASGIRKGLLLNFGSTRLEFKRRVW